MNQITLRFFDVQVEVTSDSQTFLAYLDRVYRRFRSNSAVNAFGTRLAYAVLTRPAEKGGSPVMIQNGKVWRAPSAEALTAFAGEDILHGALCAVRSHYLIHAGAAAWKGGGVLLAGDTGGGKTTLVLELVRRGFKFFSDEIGAIRRADGRLDPFPRALRVRPKRIVLKNGSKTTVSSRPTWFDIEALSPKALGRPVPLKHVFILDPRPKKPAGQNGHGGRELKVLVSRLHGDLLAAVRRIEGVTQAEGGTNLGFPEIQLKATDRTGALSEIEQLCAADGVLILNIAKRPVEKTDFSQSLSLESLPTSEAVMALLRQFQPGHRSALLQDELGGSPARLFSELAGLVGRAQCYRLRGGSVEHRADVVTEVLGRTGHRVP